MLLESCLRWPIVAQFVVVLAFMGVLPSAAQTLEQTCGPVPSYQSRSEQDEKAKVDLNGKANVLSKYIGDAGINAAIDRERHSIYQSADKVAAAQKDAYLAYMFCVLITQDKTTTFDQRLKALNEFRRPIASVSPPASGSTPPTGPAPASSTVGVPTLAYYRNPSLAPMAATTPTGDGSLISTHELGLYSCIINGNLIDCYLTETRTGGGSANYRINDLFRPADTMLFDELHDSHKLVRSTWLDGKGLPHAEMNIDHNDPAWFMLEFDGAEPGITKARIQFRAFTGGSISGPITGGGQ